MQILNYRRLKRRFLVALVAVAVIIIALTYAVQIAAPTYDSVIMLTLTAAEDVPEGTYRRSN